MSLNAIPILDSDAHNGPDLGIPEMRQSEKTVPEKKVGRTVLAKHWVEPTTFELEDVSSGFRGFGLGFGLAPEFDDRMTFSAEDQEHLESAELKKWDELMKSIIL